MQRIINQQKPDDMQQRFVSIWFRYLATDWFSLRQPQLKSLPFILRGPDHNRMIVKASNAVAERAGIFKGTVLADARIAVSNLEVMDDRPEIYERLLKRLAEWCIRFTPSAAIDLPDGLLLDASGCTHLWGGDGAYISDISSRLKQRGYDVRISIADTIGAAWAIARYSNGPMCIPPGHSTAALLDLPPQALRIELDVIDRLRKLGLKKISSFINLPRPSLRRRFGVDFIQQLDKATGQQIERLQPVIPRELYQERLPCLEPIVSATGIGIALDQLLNTLCERLRLEQKGLRKAIFKYYRVDGKVGSIDVGTNRPSRHASHLRKLFDSKLDRIEPDMGIELFVLEAPVVEDAIPEQDVLWNTSSGLNDIRLAELVDKLSSRIGQDSIRRYLPAEHHWPERSVKATLSLEADLVTSWLPGELRPFHMLRTPERIDVSAPIPDYPPMLFVYKGKVHEIRKADGPERIEQEWWQQKGEHRDYYRVEDQDGHRYWLFRLGHYNDKHFQWYLHGFFA